LSYAAVNASPLLDPHPVWLLPTVATKLIRFSRILLGPVSVGLLFLLRFPVPYFVHMNGFFQPKATMYVIFLFWVFLSSR